MKTSISENCSRHTCLCPFTFTVPVIVSASTATLGNTASARVTLPLRGHSAMSDDISRCHNLGGGCGDEGHYRHLVGRGYGGCSSPHKAQLVPTAKNSPAPNVHHAEVYKPCSGSFHTPSSIRAPTLMPPPQEAFPDHPLYGAPPVTPYHITWRPFLRAPSLFAGLFLFTVCPPCWEPLQMEMSV